MVREVAQYELYRFGQDPLRSDKYYTVAMHSVLTGSYPKQHDNDGSNFKNIIVPHLEVQRCSSVRMRSGDGRSIGYETG